jgi:hypothetical protein
MSTAAPIADLRFLLAAERIQAQRMDIPVRFARRPGRQPSTPSTGLGTIQPMAFPVMPSILPTDVFDAASLGLFQPSLARNVLSLS